MILTRPIFKRAVQLLASDTVTFANADGPLVHLTNEPFTPTPDIPLVDLTAIEATFSGYAAIELVNGTQPTATDPATSDFLLQGSVPAGGLRWETTGDTGLPQTITGWFVTSNAGDVLYASARLPADITLTLSDQVVEVSDIIARYLASGVI